MIILISDKQWVKSVALLIDLLSGIFSSSPRPASLGVFTQRKGTKKYCIVQFSLRTRIKVTFALLDAALMKHNG